MRPLLFLLAILPTLVWSQKITPARITTFAEKVKAGDAIVYGNFVQRLGFSSGGFLQRVVVMNQDSNAYFSFVVKPAMKSARENLFCVHLPAGKYSIITYVWVQSKWYGGKIYGEPIFKNRDGSSEEFNKQLHEGSIKESELERYSFTVAPDDLTYVGKWNFDNPLVSFDTTKQVVDEKIKNRYKKIDFKKAKVSLPE